MAGTMRKETSLDDIFHPPIYRGVSEDVRLRSQSSLPSLDTGNSIVGSESNQSRPRSKSTGEDVLENGGILLETTPDPTEFVTVYDLTEGSHMTMPECIAQCTLLSKTQTPLSASEIQVRHYSRHRTQAALSFMGCRVGYAAAVTAWVFDTLRKRFPLPICEDLPTDAANRSCISILSSRQLMSLISEGLALYEHSRLFRIKDFVIANDIFQQRRSFIIILGGNSGTGKSTLASILASRLGVTSVLSTDSIRHTLRSLVKKEDNPCLFVSTYEAGELYVSDDDVLEGSSVSSGQPSAKRLHKRKVIRGYMLQSLPVLDSLENILTSFERRNRSLIVEGVHLSMDVIVKIMKKHPGIIPFLIHISNEKKHMERFAIRSRNMTLSPKKNKYIKYFGNINCIQKLQRKMAQKHLIPMVDNTNVDRSVATIHSTIVQVLRRLSEGKTLLNSEDKCVILSREFERLHQTAWSSKSMRAILQQKVSKRILLKKLLLESPGPHGELATRIHHEDSSSSSDGSDHGYSDEEEEEGVEDEHKLREYSNNLDDHSESRFTAPAHGSPRFGGTEAAEIGSLFDGSRTQDLFSSEDEKGF